MRPLGYAGLAGHSGPPTGSLHDRLDRHTPFLTKAQGGQYWVSTGGHF